MQIAYSLEAQLTDHPTVLTIGKFDGLHIGHQQLIRTTVEQARRLGFVSAVLTWEPHPGKVIQPDRELRLLTSATERNRMIADFGVDRLLIAPFTRETMATPAAAYMAQICRALPVREIWVGADFAMGRGREGDVPRLIDIGRELGYAICTVAPIIVEGAAVSASRIRHLLSAGDTVAAAALLGRPFRLSGTVVAGDKRGRSIGFPTANLAIDPELMLPANGVYACRVYFGEAVQAAVTNVGLRPTFDGLRQTVEAHLLNWSGDLYGRSVQLEFLQRLREERKFRGIDELVAQIERDAAGARAILGIAEP
jgi:riboflavin kinase / FMN adenylyltransferase